jgi:hypothetical protein
VGHREAAPEAAGWRLRKSLPTSGRLDWLKPLRSTEGDPTKRHGDWGYVCSSRALLMDPGRRHVLAYQIREAGGGEADDDCDHAGVCSLVL